MVILIPYNWLMKKKWDRSIKDKAISLRKRGYSLSEVSDRLNIPFGTVQGWVKYIKLSKAQRLRLKEKVLKCGKVGLSKILKTKRVEAGLWKKAVKEKTKKFKGFLTRKSDAAKLACGLLYLCEGAKYPTSKQLIFGSSDPRLIRTFLELLRDNFNIDEDKLRCRIMHRYDQNPITLRRYWSNLTRIPLSKFYKSYKDKRTKGIATKKKNYHGICALQYNSTKLQYELQLIGESIYN
jgi:hypothetical protein